MKIIKRRRVSRNRYGRAVFNNHNLEKHEESTVFYLTEFGFDVETIIPSNIPKSKNPDLLMLGATWEMKGPTVYNETTIHTMFRKAVKQSGGRVVFDLRGSRKSEDNIEKCILNLFEVTRGMKRMMIIKRGGYLLDIIK